MKYSKFWTSFNSLFWGTWLLVCLSCLTSRADNDNQKGDDEYIVAAYYWPSCHVDPRSKKIWWEKGIGEWEIVQKATPRFEGHRQPRVPLWGYVMDDDPKVMEKKLNAAADHGVNTLIFDWYWYEGEPFLEEALNKGFLQASNNDRINFYLCWANHNTRGIWNAEKHRDWRKIIWDSEVDWENFEIIVDRIITRYFGHPSYLKIEGKPVFNIFWLKKIISSFDGLGGAKRAVDYFRDEAKKAGHSGVYFQLVYYPDMLNREADLEEINEALEYLNIDSVTAYNWGSFSKSKEDYLQWGEEAVKGWDRLDSAFSATFYPNVTVGDDLTPRIPERHKKDIVHINNTPASFGAYLQKAREFLQKRPAQPKLITLGAWNEWTEGNSLEPCMHWGYGYLEAIEKVMAGEWDY